MKMKLIDLAPRFIKLVAPLAYEHTDNVREADGLQLQCPACHWADARTGGDCCRAHAMTIWGNPERWQFVGRSYRDLSLMAGRVMVTLEGNHARFYIRAGKVDFY
jgi:hypothetical protein